jgi:hypothetical protein
VKAGRLENCFGTDLAILAFYTLTSFQNKKTRKDTTLGNIYYSQQIYLEKPGGHRAQAPGTKN